MMLESLENWLESLLRERRFLIAAIAFVVSLILILLIPLILWALSILPQVGLQILITSLGTLGTVVLAILTYLTVMENRILVTEREKSREKPVQEFIIKKGIDPAIQVIEQNQERLITGNVDWNVAESSGRSGALSADLQMCGEKIDSDASKFISEMYPDADNTIRAHDEEITELDECGKGIVERMDNTLNQFIKTEQGISMNKKAELKNLVMQVHPDWEAKVETSKLDDRAETADWWNNDRRDRFQEHFPAIQEWQEARDEYLRNAEKQKKRLEKLKKRIVLIYGINLSSVSE
jgi:hypothetical protein